ncbi:MAG TPA: hypothetical protein DFR83_02345, partial [Deltaproteobacteria bacterium]|nr:hypothetical protein [Deltaproteobacteria bacterium]
MTAASVNHLSLAAQQVVVPAERDGGASVRLPDSAAAITIVPLASGPPLRAIEVTVPPSVKVLDLSRLPLAPWICVLDARQLEVLMLPPPKANAGRKGSRGAEVHLSLDAAPALRVHGGVASLDACWLDEAAPRARLHELRTRGPGRQPWNGLWLGTSLPAEPAPTLVLHSLPGEKVLDITHLETTRGLELHGSAIERLELGTAQRVTLEACASLSVLRFRRIEQVAIRRCHALEQVAGEGEALSLFGMCGTSVLAVDGRWSRISLRDSTWPMVNAPSALSIRLQGDTNVRMVVGAPGHHLAITGLAVPDAPAAGA